MRHNALIVDDDECALAALSGVLHLHLPHLTIDTSSSSSAAFHHMEAKSYSVVVTDVNMPGMDGFSLLAKAKTSESETPVIFMSGLASVPLAERAFGAGAFDVLPKPFRRETLVASLCQALRAQDLARDIDAADQRVRRLQHHVWTLNTELTSLGRQAVRLLNPAIAEAVILHSRALAARNHAKASIEQLRKRRAVLRDALRAVRERAYRDAWVRVQELT
jgi:DNA-binding NtrC family response regulator